MPKQRISKFSDTKPSIQDSSHGVLFLTPLCSKKNRDLICISCGEVQFVDMACVCMHLGGWGESLVQGVYRLLSH